MSPVGGGASLGFFCSSGAFDIGLLDEIIGGGTAVCGPVFIGITWPRIRRCGTLETPPINDLVDPLIPKATPLPPNALNSPPASSSFSASLVD